jgi:isopentenyl-diphosphate delta-isomerase
VDYILFLTADVTVTPNSNEIRDYKYVDKDELQAMFQESGESPWNLPILIQYHAS